MERPVKEAHQKKGFDVGAFVSNRKSTAALNTVAASLLRRRIATRFMRSTALHEIAYAIATRSGLSSYARQRFFRGRAHDSAERTAAGYGVA